MVQMECTFHSFKANLGPRVINDNYRFRWVVCQLDSLRKCLNLKKLRDELKALPKPLDETYERVLSRINDDGYSTEALTILKWLCFSVRPLRIAEMGEVLAIDLDSCQFDPEQRFLEPQDILKVCSSLVSVAPASSINVIVSGKEIEEIRLAHFSVKEYLTCSRIQRGPMSPYSILPIPSHTTIAEGCIAYLLYLNGANIMNKDKVRAYPLALYATQSWTYHARIAVDQDQESKEIVRLKTWVCNLLKLEDWFLSFMGVSGWLDRCEQPAYFEGKFKNIAPILFYMSSAGLLFAVKFLLDRGADINAVSKRFGGTALTAAAAKGHETVVRQLLDVGADINIVNSGGFYGTALATAAAKGHETVVRQLLDAGANINIINSGGYYGTALAAAAGEGHERVVLQLLDAGADVNITGSEGYYGTALAAAAGGGNETVVRQLLDAGAVVNITCSEEYYGTALVAAAGEGRETVVRQLLDAGAEVNIICSEGYYGTAMVAAADGHETVVRQLLDAGADVSIALAHARQQHRTKLLQLLDG
jgi:ankyrin repeat domain-containing protein 50